MLEKLKSLLEDDQVFLVTVVCLVGVLSFGLGRWSATPVVSQTASVINITDTVSDVTQRTAASQSVVEGRSEPGVNNSKPAEVPTQAGSGVVVGSRNGTRYHLPSCPGAKQIKPENLVTFSSIAAARSAGYTPAANCPGL